LHNTEISIKIFDIAESYNFTNWIDSSLGDELSQYVSPSVTSKDILLSISKDVSRYHLEGIVETLKPKYVREINEINVNKKYILAASKPENPQTGDNTNVAIIELYNDSSKYF